MNGSVWRSRRSIGMVLRNIVILAAGGWLIWQVVAVQIANVAVYARSPRLLALMATRGHPKSAAVWAESLLMAKHATAARELARSIVEADPTNDRAVRVLGLATELTGDKKRGAVIMRAAASLGWRDTPTQLWMIRDAATRGDAVAVIQRADALARRNREGQITQSIFLASLSDPKLRAALVDSLGEQPFWRGAFFANVGQRLPDQLVAPMASLIDDLSRRGAGVTSGERLIFIDRLIALGHLGPARTYWARAFRIPPDQLVKVPFDGDFGRVAIRSPDVPVGQFEWRFNADLAGSADFVVDSYRPVLAIGADLQDGTAIITQLMMLLPATYVLTAQVTGDPRNAAARWTITCMPSGKNLPRVLANGTSDELSRLSFTVPSDGCVGQKLALETRDQLDAKAVRLSAVAVGRSSGPVITEAALRNADPVFIR